MKVVILAGGFGTRLSEYTDKIPKPMVEIGGIPMIEHIMNHYDQFGFKEFIICLGYKQEIIKDYFINYNLRKSDILVDLKDGKTQLLKSLKKDWKVNLIQTGISTKTGGRIKKIQNLISDENFLLTYGDGLSNININKLIEFHKEKGKSLTISAFKPQARFGELEITNGEVDSFQEKPQLKQGRINGGFFVVKKKFIDYIHNENEMLELEPIQRAIEKKDVAAYETDEFWRCVDSKRDLDYIRNQWEKGSPLWIV
jgi:glucose-1-phosphate cytidylyltransferase